MIKPTLTTFLSVTLLALTSCSTSEASGDEIDSGLSDTTSGESGTGSESDSGTDNPTTAADNDVTSSSTNSTTADTSTDTTDSSDTDVDPGELLGQFVLTYYWFLYEADYDGPDATELVDADCNPITTVPAGFADDVCIEGAGKLSSGEVINVDGTCACGYPCGGGNGVCFTLLDPVEFPWGSGSSDNPLEPLRSWAVDPAVITHGAILYAPDWDGMIIPAIDGIGGFTHDGCFRADDVGGGINGMHVDFFAGTTSMWNSLEAMFPSLEQEFAVYQNSPACAGFGG